MSVETRNCQNCKTDFNIEPEDFDFYKKIDVPPPTFCPQCRLQRRLVYMRGFRLYKRPCGLCLRDIISVYSPDDRCIAYCPECWWSEKWDPMQQGRDYNFSRPFFEQYNELTRQVPVRNPLLDLKTFATAPYNSYDGNLKNCYLLFYTEYNEDSAYGFYMRDSRWLIDSSFMASADNCYDSMHCYKVNGGIGLRSQVYESLNCSFLKDCANCQDCFASANLKDKKYVAFNREYTREEYKEVISRWDLGSYRNYQDAKRRAEEHWKTLPPKPRFEELSVNCTGDNIFESKNVKDSYEVMPGCEDSRFVLLMKAGPVRDAYDHTEWGNNTNRTYECVTVGDHSSDIKFSQDCGENSRNLEYCKGCLGSSNLFGCVSLRKKEYCIFNKQYTKEEYEDLVPRIRKHMNDMPYQSAAGIEYKYGEFFPPELCAFAYNDTFSQNFFPLKKEEALAQGYTWHEPDHKEYTITIKAEDLPDHIKDVSNDILNEVMGCISCRKGFRIIPLELQFLKNKNLPLPRQCPFCRINDKFNVWVKGCRQVARSCKKCSTEFMTRYTEEDAPEILCKQCYQQEMI